MQSGMRILISFIEDFGDVVQCIFAFESTTIALPVLN